LRRNIPTPGLEPGPLKDKVLSLACLPISSHRRLVYNFKNVESFEGKITLNRFSKKKFVSTKGIEVFRDNIK
jgi:hypothetical protein